MRREFDGGTVHEGELASAARPPSARLRAFETSRANISSLIFAAPDFALADLFVAPSFGLLHPRQAAIPTQARRPGEAGGLMRLRRGTA